MASIGCVTLHAVIDDNYVIPGFRPGETQRALECTSYPVGKGVSCAAAVADLGGAAQTAVVVLCGTTDVGSYQKVLGRSKFSAVDVIGGPEKTRRHVTIIDPKSDAAVTHVQVPGLPHPAALFVPGGPVMAAVARLAAPGVTIALSGSLPSGAPTHLYATLIETIRAKGGKAVLDTSGQPLRAGLEARPFAVKPNRAEAEALLEHPLEKGTVALASAGLEIIERFGVTWVLLSDGADGLVVAGPHGVHHGKVEMSLAQKDSIVNDQGCGDSVVAAFLVCASQRSNLSAEHLALLQSGQIPIRVETVFPQNG